MVAHLKDAGALWSEEWVRAFLTVPRHELIPNFLAILPGPEDNLILDEAKPDQKDLWLETAYRNVPAVTRTDGGGGYRSSSSAPATMAKMLEWLRIGDQDSVLEIGTGSGYNAALLSERLGAERVTSIDLQPDLIKEARDRLASIGYTPHLAVADGAGGYPDRAPYDRLICTCAVWPIPVAWRHQVRPGGRIVTVIPDGCMGLDVEPDRIVGNIHRDCFDFMRMQNYMLEAPADQELLARSNNEASTSRTLRYPFSILNAGGTLQHSFQALVSLIVTPACAGAVNEQQEPILFDLWSGSWARVSWRTGQVDQSGGRRLWDEIEDLFEQWCGLGAPNRERFGLTISADDRHTLWLDSQDSPHRWDLPVRRDQIVA
jgi:protein-L-isoaspartate(D-aspartate) O-methyltransferase